MMALLSGRRGRIITVHLKDYHEFKQASEHPYHDNPLATVFVGLELQAMEFELVT